MWFWFDGWEIVNNLGLPWVMKYLFVAAPLDSWCCIWSAFPHTWAVLQVTILEVAATGDPIITIWHMVTMAPAVSKYLGWVRVVLETKVAVKIIVNLLNRWFIYWFSSILCYPTSPWSGPSIHGPGMRQVQEWRSNRWRGWKNLHILCVCCAASYYKIIQFKVK